MNNQPTIYNNKNKAFTTQIGDVVYFQNKTGCYLIYKFYDDTTKVAQIKIITLLQHKNKGAVKVEYEVEPKYQKQGIATSMLELNEKELFVQKVFDKPLQNMLDKKTECDEIILVIDKNNIASQKVAQKAGFELSKKCNDFVAKLDKQTYLKQFDLTNK